MFVPEGMCWSSCKDCKRFGLLAEAEMLCRECYAVKDEPKIETQLRSEASTAKADTEVEF